MEFTIKMLVKFEKVCLGDHLQYYFLWKVTVNLYAWLLLSQILVLDEDMSFSMYGQHFFLSHDSVKHFQKWSLLVLLNIKV